MFETSLSDPHFQNLTFKTSPSKWNVCTFSEIMWLFLQSCHATDLSSEHDSRGVQAQGHPFFIDICSIWSILVATFTNQQIIEIQCSGATGAISGLPWPTSKSLKCNATSKSLKYNTLGLLGLPWGYLCQPGNHSNAKLYSYWGDLGATFAKQ